MGKIFEYILANGFIFEVLIATAMFTFSLPRRNLFWLRLLGGLAVFFAVALTWDLVFGELLVSQIFKFITLFLLRVLGIWLCFDVRIMVGLFCEIGAFSTSHMIYKVAAFLRLILVGYEMVYYVLYFVSFGLIYLISYVFFARKIKGEEAQYIGSNSVIILGVALITMTTVVQLVLEQYVEGLSLVVYGINTLYGSIVCIFTLCILFGIFKSDKLQYEYKVMEHVYHMKEDQLESSRDNIDLINIKCHDLKHQITKLSGKVSQSELDELSNIIMIYDNTIKTGCEALDVVLTEKSLHCEHNNIKLHHMVDGESLSCISKPDIYSLFGNALDNALEALEKVEEVDNRIVSLSVKQNLGMISIHIENFFAGELNIDQGTLKTTKRDNNYHGFGMKSIKMIAEKYGGESTFYISGNKFNLDIIIPVPLQK